MPRNYQALMLLAMASLAIGPIAVLGGGQGGAAGVTPAGTAFTYQGQLNQGGVPVNSTCDFEFSLWDAVAGPNQIGVTQIHNAVPVADGLFTVLVDFGPGAFNGNARWLEIAVRCPAGAGLFTTLTPRRPLTPAPYALRALGPWAISPINKSDIFYDAGNVGIGTTSPAQTMEVEGGVFIDNSGFSHTLIPRTVALTVDGQPGADILRLRDAAALVKVLVDSEGNVGIGTIIPANRLTVNGDADFIGNVGIGTNAPANRLTVNGDADFAGNVGIGTTIPTARLDVAGGNLQLSNSTATGGNILKNGQLFLHDFGTENTFLGLDAGNLTMSGNSNSAFGQNALLNNTTGSFNSAFGANELFSNTTGDANSAFGADALALNTTGTENSAFGRNALLNNSTGNSNAAFGVNALANNLTGTFNSASGFVALLSNTTGSFNSAFGSNALEFNTTGTQNSAFGGAALRFNTTGIDNAAFGQNALHMNTTGSGNIALGHFAGSNHQTGDDNIYIGNVGLLNESGQIRIGTGFTHTDAYIRGISGNPTTGAAVFVHPSGKLGVAASSIRFKEAVRDMEDASSVLMDLRPVAFKYREAVANAQDTEQYGLIAEEVAKVAPGLVQLDEDGKPFAVRYHFLSPMLLNEVQKQHRAIEDQASLIEQQKTRIDALEARLGKLESLLAD